LLDFCGEILRRIDIARIAPSVEAEVVEILFELLRLHDVGTRA
jgi:hypothetical protein